MDNLDTINLAGFQFSQKTSRYSHPKILLVEDSPVAEDLMRHLFRRIDSHSSVKCVPTAESALSLLESSHYDLVIADHFLAGKKTGLDFWRICHEKFAKLPVVLTSAMSKSEFLSLVKPAEQPFYLPKPISTENRIQMLKKFMSEALIQKKNRPSLASYIFDTTTFLGIILLFLIVPNQILGTKQDAHKIFQPSKIQELPAEDIQVQPAPPPTPINVKDIITPELKQRVDEIVKRANEINALNPHVL
jgi:CheY-like chemotaxis protein